MLRYAPDLPICCRSWPDGRGRPSGTAKLCVRFLGVLEAPRLDNSYVLGMGAYDLSISVSAGTITVS